MKNNNARIKEYITETDKIFATETIASSYFNGNRYTPYYGDVAEIVAIAKYFIEGLEFEENENIYDSVIKDSIVMNLIEKFDIKTTIYCSIMDEVRTYVSDIVEFEKQKLIHNSEDMSKIVRACNVIIDSFENFSKLDITSMNKEDLNTMMNVIKKLAEKDFSKEDFSEILKNASGFDMDQATKEIIDTKNAEIRDLKKYKALWESRNVTNENKIVEMPTKE